MAQLKNLIVNGVARIVGKVFASEFIGNLTGNANTATQLSGFTNGSWNPRGTTLVKDMYYGGGDISISASNEQLSISVDGLLYQNEGRYQCLDTNNWPSYCAAASHSHSYLPLSGGVMTNQAIIQWTDTGSWGAGTGAQGDIGGLYWTGQSDGVKLYCSESSGDNLELCIKFTDDNSNGLSLINTSGTTTTRITANGYATFNNTVTAPTFSGNLSGTATSATQSSYASSINSREPTLSVGDENCNIDIRQHNNSYAFSKWFGSTWGGMRNAIRWNWYSDYWEIGGLRSGGTPSAGFGFAYNGDGKAYISTDGTMCAIAFRSLSDKNLKDDIKSVKYDISSLKTYRYTFKEDKSKAHHVGLIAQEVQQVIPDAVSSNGDNSALTLDYNAITAVLVSVVNEQQKQINQLKDEIASLKHD